MKKIGILAIVGLLLVGSVFAFNGFNPQNEERVNEMTEIFESGTYDDWIISMNQRHEERMLEMTPELFEQKKEIHTAMTEGDFEKAQELKEKYGFGLKDGSKKGFGKGHGPRDGSRHSMGKGLKDGSGAHEGCPLIE